VLYITHSLVARLVLVLQVHYTPFVSSTLVSLVMWLSVGTGLPVSARATSSSNIIAFHHRTFNWVFIPFYRDWQWHEGECWDAAEIGTAGPQACWMLSRVSCHHTGEHSFCVELHSRLHPYCTPIKQRGRGRDTYILPWSYPPSVCLKS
jgi:hypothetical protein